MLPSVNFILTSETIHLENKGKEEGGYVHLKQNEFAFVTGTA